MASFEDYADFEKAKSTILTLLKEQYPNTYFRFDQPFGNQFSYLGKLEKNVFDDFSDHTMLVVTYTTNDTLVISVFFDQILYNYENIYKITNAFNEESLYGGIHISEEGTPVFKYAVLCSNIDSNVRAITEIVLPSLRSQISSITKYSK